MSASEACAVILCICGGISLIICSCAVLALVMDIIDMRQGE